MLNMLAGLMLILIANIINWLENHMLPCIFKSLTGYDCPGCGLQRSLVALLQGNIVDCFKFYPATIPILCMLLFGIYNSKWPLTKGSQIIKTGYTLVVILIIVTYITKMVTTHK